MSRLMRAIAVVAVAVLFVSVGATPIAADEKLTIETIMEKGHKGKEAPVQTISAGKADEKLIKQFLTYYEFMATQKPPLGDEAAWKKKTGAVVEALKGLEAKKPGAADAFKAAVNCKACHTDHKPKK